MPRTSKKRGNKTLTLRQKKLLKTRLMRISMVIDDYVYKQKTVATADARAYVEEVSKYKLQCLGDARCLQVIEKITRCMNSLIREQHEEYDSNNFENTLPSNYCPSPVYSLPEEDRTMLSQTSAQLYPNEYTYNNTEYSETIDSGDDNAANRNIQVEVEIHRAMSNLSINDNFETVDFSQSILKDFDKNIEKEINITAMAKTPQGKAQICKNQKIETVCSKTVLADCNAEKTQLGNKAANINILLPTAKHNNKVSNKSCVASNKENIPSNIGPNKKKRVNFSDSIELIEVSMDKPVKNAKRNCCEQNNNAGNTPQKRNSKKKDKVVKRKKKTDLNTKLNQELISPSAKTIDKSNNDSNSHNNQVSLLHKKFKSTKESSHKEQYSSTICELKSVNNSTSAYNKPMAKIYNTNIENDLSWVENIRYVREISAEESDPKYGCLADAFWENFALPADWNEKEFDYFD